MRAGEGGRGGRTTAPGVAILGGMRPARERRAAVGSMVRVGGGRGRGRGSWCPPTSCSTSTTADDGPAHVFPQIPASGAQFTCRGMGLTAQNGYSLSKDCQLVRNNSRPEYCRCPIHPSEDPAVPFSKSWILLSLRALFLFTKENKKKRQRLSPRLLPRLLVHPQPCPPPLTASLEKESRGPPESSVQVLQVSPIASP